MRVYSTGRVRLLLNSATKPLFREEEEEEEELRALLDGKVYLII